MGSAIGEVTGYAIGIAISPVPIAAVILMLFSERARGNGVAFVLAWIVGIASVATVVVLMPGLEGDDGTPSAAVGWVKLALGVLLAAAGVRQWRSRPGPSDEATTPGWMERVDGLKPLGAIGLGLALSALNPKNLLLAVAGGASIASTSPSGGTTAVAVTVFTALASVTVAAPVVAYLAASSRLAPRLEQTKDWLIANNAAVMAVLFIVFSASLLGDALDILST